MTLAPNNGGELGLFSTGDPILPLTMAGALFSCLVPLVHEKTRFQSFLLHATAGVKSETQSFEKDTFISGTRYNNACYHLIGFGITTLRN